MSLLNLYKRAQAGEYIAIILLIIFLVLFVLFNRLNLASQAAVRTEETVEGYQTTFNLISHNLIPYLRVNSVPVYELFSHYTCYKDEAADYNDGKIMVIQSVQQKMDTLFGEDIWMLELDRELCMASDEVRLTRCNIPDIEDYDIIDFQYPLFCRQEIKSGVIYVKRIT